MTLRRSLQAENLPLRQLNEGFSTYSADLLVVFQRYRVALVEQRLHEHLQRLGVEGKGFEIEGGGELRLKQFEVVDGSVGVAPDVDVGFLALRVGVNQEEVWNPDAIGVVRSIRIASSRTECQPRIFPGHKEIAADTEHLFDLVDVDQVGQEEPDLDVDR